jgi:hypothetical protein
MLKLREMQKRWPMVENYSIRNWQGLERRGEGVKFPMERDRMEETW